MVERAYLVAWFKAFLFTLAIEIPILIALFRRVSPRFRKRLGFALVANVASHPAVWFILPALGWSHGRTIVISEAWAVGIEAVVYLLAFEKSTPLHAIGASALANGASYGLGLWVRACTGWV